LETGINTEITPPSLEYQKNLEESKVIIEDQKHQVKELENKMFEMREEIVKVKLALEKEQKFNSRIKPSPIEPIDGNKRDSGRKTKPKVPSNDWLTSLVSKVSKRGLTFGWLLDVLNAITIYTVGLMVLRNIWDFFNPETQDDPEEIKKKLGQKARASFRGSIKKASLRGELQYSDPRKSSFKGECQPSKFRVFFILWICR